MCGGLGALFGPLFGSLLYYLFGFQGPFFGLGLVSLVMVTLFYKKKGSIVLREDFL